ncbi:MAG: hypothetical protein J1F63_01375 [Oscillospiraceae bacterium]|nr:hypothetical protein [Oscillospiraceae bacterium]
MLSASVKISDIDYEKTLRQMFPELKAMLDAMEPENIAVRLLKKLGDDTLPVALSLLDQLGQETKTELAIHLVNTYSTDICRELNKALVNNEWGKHVAVGRLWVEQQNDVLCLQVSSIKADYKALIDMAGNDKKLGALLYGLLGFAKVGIKLMLSLAPDALERKTLELLWRGDNKKKLMAMAKDALDKYGVALRLDDIQLMQENTPAVKVIEAKPQFTLPEKLETELLDAIAGFLKGKAGAALSEQ